jgi:MFS family permease
MVDQDATPSRKALFLRLSIVLFCAELAHGMLLYGIIPELADNKFSAGTHLLGFIPVTAVQLAGFCLAAYTLAELAFKIIAGHQVDQKGPDGPLRLGLIVSFVSVPIILVTKSPHLMLAGSILHGFGAAPVWPAVISAWTRGRSAKERGEIMGQILTGWMGGLGLGLILGNILVGLTGKVELIATYAPLVMWGLTLGAAVWGGQRLGYPAGHGMEDETTPSSLGQFPPELKVMALGLFMQNLAFGSLILAFRELVKDHLMLNPAQFGLMVLLGGGPAVALLGPLGKVSDRIGRRNAVIRSMIVVAPLLAAAPFLSYLPVSPWVRFGLMIPGLLVAGAAYAFLLPAWHALALGRIPERQRGKSLALLMSIEMAALAGGHMLGPAMYTRIRFEAPFVFAGLTFGILALIYQRGYILPQEIHEGSEDTRDPPAASTPLPLDPLVAPDSATLSGRTGHATADPAPRPRHSVE